MKVTCPECKRRIRIRRGKPMRCKCSKNLSYMRFFRKRIDFLVYLIDANIFIYANTKNDKRWKNCREVLDFHSDGIRIGTTDVIIDEVKLDSSIVVPEDIIVYKTGKLSDELVGLRTNYLKQPSEADLSMVQAAFEHPEIKGIISYDKDFARIATRGVIEKRSSTSFWLGSASQFLKKYEIKSRKKG